MSKVIIHPGFSEDAFHFTSLTKELENRGYSAHIHRCFDKNDRAKSDINITHSGGFYCPDIVLNKKVYSLVLSPPLHSRHLISMVHKVAHDFMYCIKHRRAWFWVQKTSRNVWLVISKPVYYFRFYLNANRHIKQLEQLLKNKSNILVITTEDHWAKGFPHTRHYSITPGLHDDVIYNPEKYVDMLEYSLKQFKRVKS